MIAYAAIDIRNGAAVQLVGGRVEDQRVTIPDPIGVARQWISAGFRALHVIDLDAALGSGDNRNLIAELIDAVAAPVQVGGGLRADEQADELLALGAHRVIVGTRALQDSRWLKRLVERHPHQVVAAADIRDGHVLTHGWTRTTPHSAEQWIETLAELPLAAVLVTDVSREGRMTGADTPLFQRLAGTTRHDLVAAGGIGNIADLRSLREAGVAGAVLGMALYTGEIDAAQAAREFQS